MALVRRCQVSVKGSDGVIHAIEVVGSSVFEVAAAAVARFREDGWTEPLGADVVLHVEVAVPAVTHDVPIAALRRWANGPSVSPKQELLKRPFRAS